jgi:hypothetical protein
MNCTLLTPGSSGQRIKRNFDELPEQNLRRTVVCCSCETTQVACPVHALVGLSISHKPVEIEIKFT